jgi:hypothetical protein
VRAESDREKNSAETRITIARSAAQSDDTDAREPARVLATRDVSRESFSGFLQRPRSRRGE